MVVYLFQSPVGPQKGRSGFRPDSLDPGNVIRGITNEGKVIPDLFRPDTPSGKDTVPVQLIDPIPPRPENPYRFFHQLQQVLVSRNCPARDAGIPAPSRQGRHHVVGLVPLHPQDRNLQPLENLLDNGDLGVKVLRRFLPGGLVLLVLLVPESRNS